jgi:protein O-GlcNAc transferase
LDPFPCNGGTTTCDALWMGVPVISLAGQIALGRAGASILSNVGLPELIAQTPADYIRIATDFARDTDRLTVLRTSLRDTMRRSPLCDAARFTLDLESAFRSMWKQYCSLNSAEARP